MIGVVRALRMVSEEVVPTFPRWMCDKGGMDKRSRMQAHPVRVGRPEGFRLADVEVRLATPEVGGRGDAFLAAAARRRLAHVEW